MALFCIFMGKLDTWDKDKIISFRQRIRYKQRYCIFARKIDRGSKMENKDVILENTKELVCNNGFDKVTVKII